MLPGSAQWFNARWEWVEWAARGAQVSVKGFEVPKTKAKLKSHHMKTYKMICSRNTTDYTSFEMRCTRNTIVISEFTEYTFIMVVSHNPQISELQ